MDLMLTLAIGAMTHGEAQPPHPVISSYVHETIRGDSSGEAVVPREDALSDIKPRESPARIRQNEPRHNYVPPTHSSRQYKRRTMPCNRFD